MPLKLSAAELDDALAHVEALGASDFFPQPFEIASIRHSWTSIRPVLETLDLEIYQPRPAYTMIAPKHSYTLRPIQLLNPIDALLYVALVFRLAPAIEAKRAGYRNGIVFSNVFNQGQRATAQAISSDWDGYREAVDLRLAGSGTMATADIADFFARIYLHRLENGLVVLSNDKATTAAVMRFLKAWSHGTSYGIPIGPRISNMLAEACLTEVDEYLISIPSSFVRFIDDYTMFGKDEADCLRTLYNLGSRLMVSQGLTLNMAKTRVFDPDQFRTWRLSPRTKEDEIKDEIFAKVFGSNPYEFIDYDDLTDEQRDAVDAVDAKAWLEKALAEEPADLRTVKFVLNFLSALRRPELVDIVLDNLPRLLAVSEAVARFFSVLDELETEDRASIGERILTYIAGSSFVPSYQTMWLLEPFTSSAAWNNLAEIRRLAREHQNRMIRRQAILALGEIGDRSALLDVRFEYEDVGDLEARAIIYACRSLPTDERNAFYSSLRIGGDWTAVNVLVKAVVEYAKARA